MARVVVVGGGVAGLACAWRLQQAGCEVQVLEREPVAGGRMRSERLVTPAGEFVVDRGAQFVASAYRNLLAVAAEIGLSARRHRIRPAHSLILRQGRLHAADWGRPLAFLGSRLLSFPAKLGLLRLLLALLRSRRVLDPYRPERAAGLEREDLSAFLRRTVGEEASEYLLVPSFSATFDADPEALSGAFALLTLRFVLGGFRLESFAGGTGTFTQALAERLSVRTGCEVLAVETSRERARVSLRCAPEDGEEEVEADAVAVALPGCLVPGVCRTLGAEEKDFFGGLRYGRGIVCFVATRPAPTLPGYGLAFPRREGLGLYGLAVDHCKPGVAPPGTGLLNAALSEQAARRLWDAPDASVVEHVLAALARTPVGRLEPVGAAVHRWDPMLPLFGPGHLRRLAAFGARRERSPRLAFAGDYLLGPYTEMALTSGLRAAGELARSLGLGTATVSP